MNSDQLARLIACLESVRERPAMYFRELSVQAAVHWLHGFEAAIHIAFGLDIDFGSREEVLNSHGLELHGRQPHEQMARRGISPKGIIDELLVIDIERLQRLDGRSA